jgi:hypothetical protein
MPTLLLIIPLLLAVIGIHALVCRLPLPGSSVGRFLAVGGVGGIIFAWYLFRRLGFTSELIGVLLVYALACELYIFCFTMTIGSISANLLVALATRKMTLAEIDRFYDSRVMVRKRVQRLISIGFLQAAGPTLTSTAKGEKLSRFSTAFRAFFRHPPPGSA